RDIRPMKRGGGRRYYRPDDVDLLRGIRHLLYGEGYTIRGVQRILREQGVKFVQAVWQEGAPQPPHGATEDEDFAEETVSAADLLEEDSGLRGRIAGLIGRDLGERRVRQRRRPPRGCRATICAGCMRRCTSSPSAASCSTPPCATTLERCAGAVCQALKLTDCDPIAATLRAELEG